MRVLKVLVACEESQAVCKAFRELGHKAFSCDLQECSGGHPEWHIKGDVLKVLNLPIWDLVIAHPPCTYLTVTGNRWFNVEKYGQKAIQRLVDREKAIKFFMNFANCKCKHVAIENPVGIISTVWKKPEQIIQPYQFGEAAEKKTCLFLKGLPNLKSTNIVEPPERIKFASGKSMPAWYAKAWSLPKEERAKIRSKTFECIAKAMAEQWSEYILREDK